MALTSKRWFGAAVGLLLFAIHGFGQEIKLEVLASFSLTNGAWPWASLVQGNDGNFYGTTYGGGASTNLLLPGFGPGYGSVYKITPDGTLTSVASFFGTNGANPRSALAQADDGNFYGTTHNGGNYPGNGPFGAPGAGTVFRVTTNGDLTSLVSFWITNGACPAAGLVKGPDGALYGTTRRGGAYDQGTIFRITTAGEFATLYSFTNDTDGGQPMSPLVITTDRSLYGNVVGPGFTGVGLIFKYAGGLTPLVALNETNGVGTVCGLIQARDGKLYGVSQVRGAYNYGGVYSVSTNGTQKTVASFTSQRGLPWGALVEGTDRNFYGTQSGTEENGDFGSVYQARPDGGWATLITFALTNGASPQCGLVQGRDGKLYGTCMGGGPIGANGYGTVFRVSVPSAAAPKLDPIATTGSGINLAWSAISGRVYQVQYSSGLDSTNWTGLGSQLTATNQVVATSDPDSSAVLRYYRVVMFP